MQIVNLKTVPEHLQQLGEWHHNEWGYLNPGRTLEMRLERMQAYLNDEFVPSTWVALQGDKLAGSAAIVDSDMDTHPEYTPWLASVFVSPDFRQQGTGSALVTRVMDEARQQGLEKIWLFTPDKAGFYTKLGWEMVSEEEYHGCPVSIMSVVLK